MVYNTIGGKYMKNVSKIFAVVLGLAFTANLAMAETTQFTPLNFGDNTTVKTTSSTMSTADSKNVLLDPSQVTGGTKMQNAILQLDNAQVEVRNKLLEYRTDYAKIDSQYSTTKAERKAAKQKIRQAEKKIKNLDRAKKKIKINFEQKNNI